VTGLALLSKSRLYLLLRGALAKVAAKLGGPGPYPA